MLFIGLEILEYSNYALGKLFIVVVFQIGKDLLPELNKSYRRRRRCRRPREYNTYVSLCFVGETKSLTKNIRTRTLTSG